MILLNLFEWGYEILTAFPLLSISIPSSSTTASAASAPITEIAILGLLHKMTGGAAVRETKIKFTGHDEPGPQNLVFKSL